MEINKLHRRSAESMPELDDESIHLIITSPPYNVGKEYEIGQSFDDWREMTRAVWAECHRVLVPGGRIAINVGNTGRKPYTPLNAIITQDILDMSSSGQPAGENGSEMLMRGEIIWNKETSAGTSNAWGSWLSANNPILRDIHEYILVFSKGQYDRGMKEGKDGNKGSGKSTIDKHTFMEVTKSVWTFKTESAKRVGHPAPFPVELPRRLIELYSFRDDIVLDPFMGSGTTAIAANRAHRKWIGYEVNPEYAELAEKRIDQKSHEEKSAVINEFFTDQQSSSDKS